MTTDHNVSTQARELWRSGKAIDAGRLLFEHLKPELRPMWASRLLRAVVQRTEIKSPSIDAILVISENVADWNNAHRAFSFVREATLKLEEIQGRSIHQELLLAQLYLAENVAKVVYNATNPPDPFDEEAGWWLAVCLKRVLDLLADPSFEEFIWSKLVWKN